MTRRGLIASAAALMTSACSPLDLFNRFTPKDSGGRLAVRDIAYGPDPRQRLDVYAPARRGGGPVPVLVFFYGGAWNSSDKSLYRWVGQAFAAAGFLTVVPNFRLVPQVRFPAFVEDSAAAVAKAREIAAQYGGDPDRLTLSGHSSGAYAAVLMTLDPRYLKAAGVETGVVRATAGLSGPYDFLPFNVPSSIEAFAGAPDALATQPIHFARGDAPPLFLGHGDKDTVVEPRNSIALAAAIKAKGGAVELKIYPGLDHVDVVLALSRPFRGKAPVLDDVTRFLRAHLG